ncbi:MAG: glycine--tRNA ligase [Alphaproteobacteria bacterium]|nr:glycine--tRNA ligase [Alphaproteobacteria bacterium]
MKEIVALCKRRGFIYQASEIYGGINGFWDYGPLGTELKNNLRDWWWRKMVLCPPIGPDGTPVDIVGLDSAIIQNPKVWVASGHVGGFADPMVDCKETKLRYRADHLIVFTPKDGQGSSIAVQEGDDFEESKARRFKKFAGKKTDADFEKRALSDIAFSEFANIIGPDASKPGTLTEPKAFNLLFETKIGAVASDDNVAYLRGETAQGIFVNYKNVLDSSRVKVPFGIAQIGKAFRNEVNPRNFIFRSREFEQMEMEFFCHPKDAKMWFDFWKEERQKFWQEIGLTKGNLLMREHGHNELVFYSKGTFDIEYKFPFTDPGFGELEGIAYRTDYDLTQHQTHSGTKLEYIDQTTNERFLPHVIEPAAGLTRGVLALLCEAFTPDPSRPSGVYLNFHPRLAPKKAAILPLTAKDGHPEIATKLYLELREEFPVDLDIKQNIGKRYARQDEIGTPYCLTIDNDTLKDETITVRHRNSMKQERIGLSNAKEFIRKGLESAAQ